VGGAFAAVAGVALDLRSVVPVQGEVGVDADAGWGGGLFGSERGCAAGGLSSCWVVCFVSSAGPGVGFAVGACVAAGGRPGCWVEEIVRFLWGGEVGG
jgi:hypothetical protein